MSWVLVWDLETVPDVDGFAKANGLQDCPREEIRAAMGEFPKPMYHSIICIGALAALWTADGWVVKAVGASTVGEKSERELIESFLKKIERTEPTLVTFNGNSFDMSVLRYRSMIYSLSAPCLHRKKYFHRYSDSSVDICDVLAGYRGENKCRLNDLGRMMGSEGKPTTVNGSSVEGMFTAGRIPEISNYCVGDVFDTYRIWLRYERFRGCMTQAQADYSELNASRAMTRMNYALPV